MQNRDDRIDQIHSRAICAEIADTYFFIKKTNHRRQLSLDGGSVSYAK
jgi:hypothetical protein